MRLFLCFLVTLATVFAQDESCTKKNYIPLIKSQNVNVKDLGQCEMKCLMMKECLLYQMKKKSCTLYLVKLKKKMGESFGMNNCQASGNPSGNTYCYALLMEGLPKIDLKRVRVQTDVQCAQHCDVEESCVMWRFMEKKKRCSLVQLTAEPANNVKFGARYCKTKPAASSTTPIPTKPAAPSTTPIPTNPAAPSTTPIPTKPATPSTTPVPTKPTATSTTTTQTVEAQTIRQDLEHAIPSAEASLRVIPKAHSPRVGVHLSL